MRKILIAAALATITLGASACNTVRGAAADATDVANEVDEEI